LTRVLCFLLKAQVAVLVVAVLAGIWDFYSYSTLPEDVDASEVLLPSDIAVAIVGLVQLVIAIVTAVTFLRWIYRSNKNLRLLSGQEMQFTPGWSVGWYFIPFANLFKPYQVMKEIWNVSHLTQSGSYAIVGWWWALWIISIVLGRITLKAVMRADSATSYASSAMADNASDGLDVVLNIVSLVMVSRIGNAYAQNIVEPRDAADSR
ncbi:MAG: DUF4328 domain-containing protein, partial [Pirellula sp.]